jgi:hypothetical protein
MAIYAGLYGAEFEGTQRRAQELHAKAKTVSDESKKKGKAPEASDVTEAKNILDPEKICKLAAVGFDWDLQKDAYEESWENRYKELMRFKLINGHCRVPKTGETA